MENIDKMLQQFEGREKALIAMLENMDAVERELEKDQGRDPDGSSGDDEWSEGSDVPEVRSSFIAGEEAKEEVQS